VCVCMCVPRDGDRLTYYNDHPARTVMIIIVITARADDRNITICYFYFLSRPFRPLSNHPSPAKNRRKYTLYAVYGAHGFCVSYIVLA